MKHLKLFLVVSMVLLTPTACSLPEPAAQIPSIMSPKDMTNKNAAVKNNEGVDHLVQGHYKISEKHFREAITVKNNFAAAHFNLGVALDGMGKHPEATESFRKALEFGGNNPKIAESEILKKHLEM